MDKYKIESIMDFTIEFWLVGFTFFTILIWILPYGMYKLYKGLKK
jgi:hypothetical protein